MTAHQRATEALTRAASARVAAAAVRDNAVAARDAAQARLDRAASGASPLHALMTGASSQARRAAAVLEQAEAEVTAACKVLGEAIAAEHEAAEAAEAVGLQDVDTSGPFAVDRVHSCWIGTGRTGADRCDRCRAGALRRPGGVP